MGFFDNVRHWDKFKVRRYVILLALSLAGDGWTYESSVIASIIQLPQWIQHLGYDVAVGIPDAQNQWIGPVYSLGQLVGGLMAAFVLDKFGRRPCMWVGALFMQLSTALLVWSPSFGVVIAARVIEGVSIGFLLLGYQIFAVEIAAKEDRGFVSSFSLMTGNFFSLLAAGLIYGITYSTGNAGWRASLAVTFIPATFLICVLPWVPESPRYLYEKKKYDQCRKVVGHLHGCTFDDNDEMVLSEAAEVEFEAMRAAISWDQEHGQDKWSALWNTKAARYRSFVAFSSQSWWAWNGGSVFTYYYTKVYDSAGITNPHVQFGLAGVQNASWCVGGILGGYLLDIWGRRTNYLIGVGEACICLLIQCALAVGIFDKGIENHAAGAGFVTVYLLQWFLWVMFFSPVVNMLPAEIYSAGLRARGYAISNIFSMAVGFATQYSALPMYERMHGWIWLFFAGCMAFAFIVIYFTYPETKGMTLEEVEIVFGTGAGQRVKAALGRSSAQDPTTPIHYKAEPEDDDSFKAGLRDSDPHTPVIEELRV
ncbi:general substrate transporter [Kockovaella imperatae]|uniref:General substrate transporter n=1 Tax=Kockovaella imperatae TaxID=4999 RepID=A0A1Y1UU79_9TREE|nr:general substrate transporter [Kockovaella imperatae]ORX41197.1 general substrate transporter [Kockovaella imperatae]